MSWSAIETTAGDKEQADFRVRCLGWLNAA